MPEADSHSHADAATPERGAERRRSEQRRVERALRQGALALLCAALALIAAALAGWRAHELGRALDDAQQRAELAGHGREQLAAELARLQAAQASPDVLGRLEPLPPRVDALETRLGRIEARLEAPERALARAEAAHLVELAHHRLTLEHDVAGATELYAAADARLASRSDAAALRIRAQLAHDLAALRATPVPDLRTISARLAAAEVAARDVPMLGAIQAQYLPPGSAREATGGGARAWHKFTSSLQDLVSVRRVSDASVRLVSLEEIGLRRRHLQTLLFAARLAALRADSVDYAASLGDAREWLARFCDPKDARTRDLNAQLTALAASAVSAPLPDVSGSLRMLRERAP